MSVFGKLKTMLKKKDGGRVSGVERDEVLIQRPIEFWTSVGGSQPCGFIAEPSISKEMKTEVLAIFEEMSAKECLDGENNLNLFDALVDQYHQKVENEIKRQGIQRRIVGEDIKREAEQYLVIELRDQARYAGERKAIESVTEYKEVDFDEIQKGLGDSYV